MVDERNIELSVIIPAFGRIDGLKGAVESVLRQTLHSYEVLVVDDGTPLPIEAKGVLSDARVRIIRNYRNCGAAMARNQGVAAARGHILAFLDSDDAWYPSKLEEQIRVLDDTGIHAVATGFGLYDSFRSKALSVVPVQPAELSDFAAGCWWAPGSTLLVRKAVFERVGPFDSSLRRLEDYEWFLRFALTGGRVSVVPGILADINVSTGGG